MALFDSEHHYVGPVDAMFRARQTSRLPHFLPIS